MDKYAIVAIGYNRVNSILRLLNSLQNAHYGDDTITLIISIDNSGSDEVAEAAKSFDWKHGEKKIRTFPERQGLRKHILSCADFFEEYDALYVFEDDVIVSPAYYHYGKACIAKYEDNNDIAGISLYALQWNPNANLPFSPMKSEYDTYFVQYAQSWGQIWLKKSFQEFKKWYNANLDFFEKEDVNIPSNLYVWGKNSWLKYHIAYCAMENKYFVYPYASYATVFTEAGTHSDMQLTRFHSEMILQEYRNEYKWAELDDKAVCYDAFYENLRVNDYLGKEIDAVAVIDLYGCRKVPEAGKYMLSTQILPYEVKREYGLQLRPIELNVYMDIDGKGIYLYDLTVAKNVRNQERSEQIVRKWNYFMRERFLMMDEIIPVCKQKFGNLIRVLLKDKK